MSNRRKRVFKRPQGPDTTPQDVDEEVRFHIEKKVERLMAGGLEEAEARREALRKFGDMEEVKAAMTREQRAGARNGITGLFWDRMRQDIRFAMRQLIRDPGFTLVTVLTLALGIGSTTAIFSVVDGVLLRPLPFPEPHELTVVWADWSRRGGPVDEWVNFPNYHDLKERSRTLETVGAWDGGSATLTGQSEPEEVVFGSVSHGMFSEVLVASPTLGRGFLAEDDLPNAPGTVILTDGFWRRVMGADPTVVGSALILNDVPRTILGVMAPDFDPPFMEDAEIWIPMQWDISANGCGRGGACLRAVARLAQGTTLDEARVEADEIGRQLQEEYPDTNLNTGFTLRSLRNDMVADARTGLLVLLSAVGFVLLIACVNVANLLMARATGRASELSIRTALGAGRGQLVNQLLVESALLAVLGGALGLAVAFLGTDVLIALAPPEIPRIEDVSVDGSVLLFASASVVMAGLLFGVIPSLRGAASGIGDGLREGGSRSSRGIRGIRARGALVSGQIALALILLVGAGLLVRSFQNLRTRDLGFRPEGVLTMQIGLPSTRYPDADARRSFRPILEGSLAALPGVTSVGLTSWLPLTGFGSDTGFNIEGRPLPPPGQNQSVWFRRVSSGYLDTMGMRLVSGRWLGESDDQNSPPVVVINDGLARRFFPDVDPVGQRLNMGNRESPTWREIVGVVAEARYFGIRGDSRDALYLPYDQAPVGSFFVALRSTRDLKALSGELRGAVAELDPLLAVARLRPMESLVAGALGPDRFVTVLLMLFSGAALTLAVVGLYGVVSYGVGLRFREMGVRMALGAKGGDIRGLVLRSSLGPVALGLAVGLIGGAILTRLMENLLFGVSATDPWTFSLVTLILSGVAAFASLVPARRAARVDPIQVLRAE